MCFKKILIGPLLLCFCGCLPQIVSLKANKEIPEEFRTSDPGEELQNVSRINWREYFNDQDLTALVELALKNNQELNIFLQEIEIAENEISARKGAYLPSIELGGGAGLDKVGKYTRNGATEENLNIEDGKSFPEPFPDYSFGAHASWEIDIWNKLRNAQKSAMMKYLATIEGKNFLVTNLISEVAANYFTLISLDKQLEILMQNIEIQQNALEVVKAKKEAGRLTELPLKRFEGQLYKTKSLIFEIKQQIIVTENKINFIVGRYPQQVVRNGKDFDYLLPNQIRSGLPADLLENRPDIKQAEFQLKAAELDVEVAKARFYPRLSLSGDVGYQAYATDKLINSPESLIYSLGGNLVGPLINRLDIAAMYLNSDLEQTKAVKNYEKVLLNAFMEVSNQLSNIRNLESTYSYQSQQVRALNDSVSISGTLFNSARADYMEVLLTQRDALESRFDLIDTRLEQLHASVDVYRALGGGWN